MVSNKSSIDRQLFNVEPERKLRSAKFHGAGAPRKARSATDSPKGTANSRALAWCVVCGTSCLGWCFFIGISWV